MPDLCHQKKALQARLDYYRDVFPSRSEEYRAFKLKNSIPRIHVALARIDAGTYSICMSCAENIGDTRLELVPGALYCTACQQDFEEWRKKRKA